MQLLSDYHNHPQGHRHQPYSPELLQPWVDSARRLGLRELAFTDHDRYHAGISFEAIEECRRRNPDMALRAGVELDNDPRHSVAGRAWVRAHWDQLDFVLGSIHFLDGDWAFDHAGQEAVFEQRNVDDLYEQYYERLRSLIGEGDIDCLSHLDLIKIFGFRPEASMVKIVGAVLDIIKQAGLSMELSTAGWRKPVDELYPEEWIIQAALVRGIPFTTASDAHSHVQVAENFPRLAEVVERLGIREVAVYERHQRRMLPLR